jgi:stage II sporulation protein E
MKIKSTKNNILEGNLLAGYSRNKLHCLSKTYEELARLYRDNTDTQDCTKDTKNHDRKDIFYLKQLDDTRKVFADQLDNVSEAFLDVADTQVRISTPLEHKRKALIGYLRKQGIIVREIVFLEGENPHDLTRGKITIEARTLGRGSLSSSVLGDFLSSFFGRNLVTAHGSAASLGRNYGIFIFEEGARFSLLSSVSRAVKDTERISGDNFSLEEYSQNNAVLMISDGMGSGERANHDSRMVIEFMERFLEAGFDKERAFSMVSSAVISQSEDFGLTTLDVCAINLMNGELDFMKAGAAASYIKRGKKVDIITSDTLPLGSRDRIIPITQTTKITNNDMLIMVSDGIIDAIESHSKIKLEELISRSTAKVPNELSDMILRYAINCQGGHIRDDMTVLAGRIASK